jgi:hypothetical protein
LRVENKISKKDGGNTTLKNKKNKKIKELFDRVAQSLQIA